MRKGAYIFTVISILVLIYGCSVSQRAAQKKLKTLTQEQNTVSLNLPGEQISMSSSIIEAEHKDTIIIQDLEGNDMFLVNAILDTVSGEMMANEELDAAVITARFSNVAERHGTVDVQFDITVPQSMRDSRWQLRFRPVMYILDETVYLDSVIVTGSEYRRRQLRGMDQFQRFMDTFISDSSRIINQTQLMYFLQRQIPQLYALKDDTTYVSDEQFQSIYGVDKQMAVEHYTNKLVRWHNNRVMRRSDEMYHKYVKSPIITNGIRLDTVMRSDNGDYIYSYTQNIHTRPKLRKVDIVVDGTIYEQDVRLFDIPQSDTLTFYISSVSTLLDDTERFLHRVIERKAQANSTYDIVFDVNSSELDLSLANNETEMSRIRENIHDLLCNEAYDLDSIVIAATASPDGRWRDNTILSRQRSEAISSNLNKFVTAQQDSIEQSLGILIGLDGNVTEWERTKIPFIHRSEPEDWNGLDAFIEKDDSLSELQKEDYHLIRLTIDPDEREENMKKKEWFRYVHDRYYPQLRSVKFRFALHRKGMVKDTIVTTEPDTVYAAGIQAIRDRDYDLAAVLLAPYQDYNTAVAYISLDRNRSALQILEPMEHTANVNYLLALAYSRLGNIQQAVQCYMDACNQDGRFVSRGNLDPEIAALIKRYDLNKDDYEFEY